jgi:hypothetical protein
VPSYHAVSAGSGRLCRVEHLDGKTLERVRKLLAKAEHPGTPVEEAQAFSAKASALMARYAIDAALLEHDAPSGVEPVVRHLRVDPPYAMARAVLLDRVARAHRVRVVIGPDAGGGARSCTLVGFPVDLQAVDVLFTSLLLQASSAMLTASADHPRPKAFRRAFLLGYADVIGARLAAAQAEVERDVTAAAPGAALVLVGRGDRVQAVLEREFPRLRSLRMSTSSAGGLAAGRTAATRADLATSAHVGAPRRRQLG